MAKMQLYRIINPLFEQTGEEMDTSQRNLTPRLQRTVALTPVFELIVEFWKNTGCQLTTAVQALTEWNLYCHVLETVINHGDVTFSAQNINNQDYTILKTKDILLYFNKYVSLGIFLDPNESWAIWEYLWERGRQQLHSNCISRFECVFAFATKRDADKYLQERQTEDKEHNTHTHIFDKTCAIDVINSNRAESYDMRWLDCISIFSTYDLYEKVVNRYWNRKMTKNPLMEVLFQGTYCLRNM